jgi:hypothetical protein
LVCAHHHYTITEAHRSCDGVLLGLMMVMVVMVVVKHVGGSCVAVGYHG